MKSQNTKSSNDLKKEVDRELKTVRRDLDKMTDFMTPGHILDRAVFKRHNRSVLASIDHLKNNPIGTAFLSMGTLLLMEDEYNETYETKLHNRYVDLKGQAALHKEERTERIADFKETVQNRAADLKTSVKDKMADIKESFQIKKDSVVNRFSGDKQDNDYITDVSTGVHAKVTDFTEKFGEAKTKVRSSDSDYDNWTSSNDVPRNQKIKENFSEAKEKVTSGPHTERYKIQTGFESGRETFANMDPITSMALGAGLGVLTGAALPVFEKEQSLVDSHLPDKLTEFDHDLRAAINECSGILKDLVVEDVKNYSFKVF